MTGMRKSLEVVDGFHAEPMLIRELALRTTWRAAGGADLPAGGTWTADGVADGPTVASIRTLLGFPGAGEWGGISRACFTAVGGSSVPPAVTNLGLSGWAALVWLSPPDVREGGISFYQPRKPVEHNGDGGWEETMFIPARFNRLVLFAADTAYRCALGFGESPRAGLLAQFLLVEPTAAT